jgi:hypothetical protein
MEKSTHHFQMVCRTRFLHHTSHDNLMALRFESSSKSSRAIVSPVAEISALSALHYYVPFIFPDAIKLSSAAFKEEAGRYCCTYAILEPFPRILSHLQTTDLASSGVHIQNIAFPQTVD